MRQKTLKFVITFHTTTDAMAMEKLCKNKQAPGRLIPVPREISAGCGLSWAAPTEAKDALLGLMAEDALEAEGTYEILI